MAVSKQSIEDQLEKALAYVAVGKSPREAEKMTNVNYKRIEREAKKRGIVKGSLSQLVVDKSRVETEVVALPDKMREIVTKEADIRTQNVAFYDKAQNKLAGVAMAMIDKRIDKCTGIPTDELSPVELSVASKVIKESREGVVGKAPEVAIQINNGFESVLTRVRRD